MIQRRNVLAWLGLLALCLGQAWRNVDFTGYWHVLKDAAATGWPRLPYPAPGQEGNGAFFQSPLFVVQFFWIGYLPLSAAKAVWSALNAAAFLWWLRRLKAFELGGLPLLFLLVACAHPLSDVFLSGNSSFLSLVMAWEGLYLLQSARTRRQLLGSLLLSSAIAWRLTPAYVLLLFVLPPFRRGLQLPRVTVWMAFALIFWVGLAALFFSWPEWWASLKLYGKAAGYERLAFQSISAQVYRCFALLEAPQSLRRAAQGAVVVLVFAASLAMAWRQKRFESAAAVLFAALYQATPFAWTLTALALLPLWIEYARGGIERLAWFALAVLALLPQAFVPSALWNSLAYCGHEAAARAVLWILALRRCGSSHLRA